MINIFHKLKYEPDPNAQHVRRQSSFQTTISSEHPHSVMKYDTSRDIGLEKYVSGTRYEHILRFD